MSWSSLARIVAPNAALPSAVFAGTMLAIALTISAMTPAFAEDGAQMPFAEWIAALKQQALARGISKKTVDEALDGVTPVERVVQLDRHQPEFTQTLTQYLHKRVTPEVVAEGRAELAQNRKLLDGIEKKYGVPARYLVALWGIETQYGRYTGGFNVIQALATLSYDLRRRDRFRDELFDALEILDHGDITLAKMQGSWAGAMGQNQFMPSVFVRYAQDYDGDGRRNIWTSKADVLASAANYLAKSGWKPGETWGRKVRLPGGFDYSLVDDFTKPLSVRDLRKPIWEWRKLGIRRDDGGVLPGNDMLASLILPEGPGGPAYLVYNNFRVVMTWNPAFLFAVTVGTLADRIQGG